MSVYFSKHGKDFSISWQIIFMQCWRKSSLWIINLSLWNCIVDNILAKIRASRIFSGVCMREFEGWPSFEYIRSELWSFFGWCIKGRLSRVCVFIRALFSAFYSSQASLRVVMQQWNCNGAEEAELLGSIWINHLTNESVTRVCPNFLSSPQTVLLHWGVIYYTFARP